MATRRVFWDLETTGFLPRGRIVTLGWACDDEPARELLVLPAVPIEADAQATHGWTVAKLRAAGALPVEAALRTFCAALQHDAPTLLCAHNGKSFDTHVLRAELERTGVQLPPNVVGFVDTLHWCRKRGLKECSLDALSQRFLGLSARETHSAVEDAVLLGRVVRAVEAATPSTTTLDAAFETVAAFDARTHKAAVRGIVDAMLDATIGDAAIRS